MTVRTETFTRHFKECNDFEEHWMLNFIEQNIRRAGVWIDAGANVGNHTVHFSMFGACELVVAIEPVIENFELLQRNIIQNQCINVIPILAGVGATEHFAHFAKADEQADTLYTYRPGGKTPIITIDGLGLTGISLMKLDVEGMELDVIRGAHETLLRDEPELFLEAFEQQTIDSHKQVLEQYGYKYLAPYNHGWMHHYSKRHGL